MSGRNSIRIHSRPQPRLRSSGAGCSPEPRGLVPRRLRTPEVTDILEHHQAADQGTDSPSDQASWEIFPGHAFVRRKPRPRHPGVGRAWDTRLPGDRVTRSLGAGGAAPRPEQRVLMQREPRTLLNCS